jgi:hypothetical protein
MPYYNVSWGGVVEAENFDAAETFARECGKTASRLVYAELGGLFCGMEYLNDAEDVDGDDEVTTIRELSDEEKDENTADDRCEICNEYESECLCVEG